MSKSITPTLNDLLLKMKPPENNYLCLAVLDGVLCVIFLHGRSSPQTSPSATPCLMKSLSFEVQPEESEEHPLSPMHYARSGLGTAALNGKLIAAGSLQAAQKVKHFRDAKSSQP